MKAERTGRMLSTSRLESHGYACVPAGASWIGFFTLRAALERNAATKFVDDAKNASNLRRNLITTFGSLLLFSSPNSI